MKPAFLLALTILILGNCAPDKPTERRAPNFELVPLGALPRLQSADLRQGDIFVVNFWASWCLPCRAEHPLLMKLARRADIKLAGIAYRDQPQNAARFLTKFGNPFGAVGLDQTGFAALSWGIKGVPESFVVDGQGRIIFHHYGPLTDLAEINQAITQAQR